MTSDLAWAAAWIAGCAAWWPAGRRLRGTTALGPWKWAGAAWGLLGLVECSLRSGLLDQDYWAQPLRLAAAAGLFCPVMSLLGAKRPQDRGWHFVVLSLWGMLVLPAAELLVLQPGQQMEIHAARAWFLWALVGVSAAQWLPTRFGGSALLLAAGQIAWLGRLLPGVDWDARPLSGTLLLAAALGSAWLVRPARRAGWSRVWLDFRDQYGLLWSLRVSQRINEAADRGGWQVRLRWNGFQPDADLDAEAAAARETCVRNLLRRFVSADWIDRRLSR